ncbi:MAG: Fe-S cluster assembly protein SufD [Ilumatobacter sp.]
MARLRDLPLPSADEEIWRYSRIDALDPTSFEVEADAVTVDGGEGFVSVGTRVEIAAEPDVFAEANSEHQHTVLIDVPRGEVVAEPIVISHRSSPGTATFPRTVVRVGENAEVTIIERFSSVDPGSALVCPVLSAEVSPAGRVNYLATNDLDVEAWQVGHQLISGDRDSSVRLSTVTLGGHYTRVRTEARSTGPGASTKQVALYFAGGDQMHDFRVIQDHDAPHTSSDLLFKGAVQDRARSVYTGLISIREHARGTAAYQTNRNLTLSAGAWAESVPNLDIRTNDVECSHASTVGPIDDDQRFYLESRGVPPETAERLVVLGFFEEVLDRLPAGPHADELRSAVAAKLDLGGDRR